MKRNYFLILLSTGILGLMINCGQSNSKEKSTVTHTDTVIVTNDSVAIIQTFEQLKTNEAFLKGLGLEDEKQFSWNDSFYRIFRGDLNGDGKQDALLGFVIEGRGGGNNSDVHYAVLLNKENQWEYNGQLDASIFADDRFFEIHKIENAVIKGNWIGNKDESLTPYSAAYIFRNGQIINTFTALHKTENAERESLQIERIIIPTGKLVPITGTLDDYQHILGKGQISAPKEQTECGTYFDEGTIRYLDYPNLHVELNDKNEVALISLEFKSGFTLRTDKGTVNENTRLEDLKNIFYKKDSWMILDEENGTKNFAIPDDPESDNQWRFSFDKNGKLIRVSLFIPC